MQDSKMRTIKICAFAAVFFLLAGCSRGEDDGLKEITSGAEAIRQTEKETEAGDTESGDTQGGDTKDGEKAQASDGSPADRQTDSGEDTVFVYVCGAVNSPGVYELDSDGRVFEAIGLAGGVTGEAAPELINQARLVTDGERIYVPTRAEADAYENGAEGLESEVTGAADGSEKGKININTAGKDELMELTGIGEAKAESILRYREEHGSFKSIEELMQIEGIKEGVFNKIKDDITI